LKLYASILIVLASLTVTGCTALRKWSDHGHRTVRDAITEPRSPAYAAALDLIDSRIAAHAAAQALAEDAEQARRVKDLIVENWPQVAVAALVLWIGGAKAEVAKRFIGAAIRRRKAT